jgi:hypothetical protein
MVIDTIQAQNEYSIQNVVKIWTVMTNNKHSISLNYIIKMVTGFSRSYDHDQTIEH